MIVIDLTPLDVALLTAGGLTLLAVAFLAVLRGRLGAEAAAVTRRADPPEVAYQRFIQSSSALTRTFIVVALLAGIFCAAFGGFTPEDGSASAPGTVAPLYALLVVVVSLAIYDLLAVPMIAGPALRRLRGLNVRTADLFAVRLKRAALLFAPLAAFALAGILLGGDWLAVVLLVVLLLYFVSVGLFGAHVYRWQIATAPLERTQWAALAPRVAAWQRLAGVELRDVRVQLTGRLGYANVQIAGVLDRTLFLSDAFLAESDWRQHDALAAWAISYARRARPRADGRVALVLIVALAAAALLVVPGLAGDLDPFLLTLCPLPVLIFLLALLASRTNRMRDAIPTTDRLAAELTGDPLALLVGLNTLNALNGLDPRRTLVSRYPSVVGRVNQLAWMTRQPRPLAPWAAQPVPSAVPVALDGRPVTVPLDQAPTPVPVPTAPYGATVPLPTPVAVR